MNRIVSANCGSAWAQTFSYDAFGNVFKAGSSTYSPSSYVNNQPVSGVTATYDANGNQTMTTLVASLTYDANHHPVAAGSTAMVYDAFGRLVEAGGKAVVYGPAGEKLGVFNGSAYTESFLLPGGSEAYYTSGSLTSLRRKDWLGSSRVATSWSHAVVSKAAYAPFGESYSVGGTTDLDFTGQTQDSVSSLYDFPARKYDPGAGRWTVPDPGGWSVVDLTNPQSFNRYAYVLNMPLVFIDPSGMDDPCVDDPTPACTITVTADPPPPCYEDASCAPPDPPLTTLLPYQPIPVYGGPGGDPNSVPQPTPTCKQQRILNAIPGATLTNPLDTTGQSVGEHTEFGITVTADQLQADGFSPFSIFGVNNGYRNGGVVMQVHANGSGGLVVSQAHIDTFNPASGLFGIIGHSIWDLGIGSLLQKLFPKTNGLLDPGC